MYVIAYLLDSSKIQDDLEAEFRKREDRLEEVRKEEDRAVEQRWMQKSLKLSKSWYLEPSELPSKQTNGPFGGSTAKQQIIPTTTPSTSEENDDIKL
jgi:hypothetical protein